MKKEDHKQSFIDYIRYREAKIRQSRHGFFVRSCAQLYLFLLYVLFATHRALYLLFASSTKSFAVNSLQEQKGTYANSYHRHVELQKGVRFFSLSTLLMILVSSFALLFVMEVLFPPSATVPVQAADNTYTVITNNNAGIGSLRTAITNANGASGSVEIVLDIVGTNRIVLASALPDLTKEVTITNNETTPVRINGGSLGSGDCWEIASGADSSTIVGLAFVDCPDNGLVISADDVTLGGSAAADNVYAYDNGAAGISITGDSNTITNTISGWPLVTGDGNTGDGFYISGSNNTLNSVYTLQNGDNGIEIALGASNTTITNSYIGVAAIFSDNNTGNDGTGIYSVGGPTTIGSVSNGNVIGQNGEYGIHFDGSNNFTVSSNTIGLGEDADEDKGNSSHGIYVESSNAGLISQNTISGNDGSGIYIGDSAGTSIVQNDIGTNAADTDFGNSAYGVTVSNSTGVSIGDTSDDGGNDLYFNDLGGVDLLASSEEVLISKNNFNNDGSEEISRASGTNQDRPTPNITGAGNDTISGEGGADGGSIQIYANGSYLGEDTTIESDGLWEVSASDIGFDDFSAYANQEITALSIDSSNNTSIFSGGVTLTTEASTLTVTESTSFDSSITVTAEIEDGGTLYYTTDGTTPTTASTSGESPLTLTFTETTTLTIFGVDTNNNTIETQTLTYTLNSESNDGGSSDGGGGNGDSGDGNDDGDNSSGNSSLNDDYLDAENVSVNTLPVYTKTSPVYAPHDDVQISGVNANNAHQVRVLVKNKKGKIVDKKWVNVKNTEWSRTVGTNLKKGVTYIISGKARSKKTPSKQSTLQKLATVVASNPEPTIVTLNDPVTVTGLPDALSFGGVFQGAYDSAQFRIQDATTGEIVSECAIADDSAGVTKSGTCALSDTLSEGDYRVLFHSLDGDLLSAADHTRLIVSKATARNVFNLDSRNSDYFARITTNSNPRLVGIRPADSTARIFLNDERVGTATNTSDIGWEYSLDLSTQQRGDHTVEVRFFDNEGNELTDDYIYYPIKYANAVVELQVFGTIPQTIAQGTPLGITIAGGANNTLIMQYNDGDTTTTRIDQNITGAVGSTQLTLPTLNTGLQTVLLQSEAASGLRSAAIVLEYRVVAVQAEANGSPEEVTNSEDEEITNQTSAEDTSTDSENNADIVQETPSDKPENVTAPSIIVDDVSLISDEGVPEEWIAPAETAEETQDIKQRLETFNVRTVAVNAQVQHIDGNGEVISESGVQKNADGVTVLSNTRVAGIDELSFFGQRQEREEQYITFNGTTDPYAIVQLTVRSDPIVQVTRADENGEWKMNVAVSAIPPGEHSAYVSTTSKGVTSEEIEIAKFVVVEEERISTTTWIFIINIVAVIIILLIAIAFQFRKRMKAMDKYSAPPVAAQGGGTAAMHTTAAVAKEIESITEASEK